MDRLITRAVSHGRSIASVQRGNDPPAVVHLHLADGATTSVPSGWGNRSPGAVRGSGGTVPPLLNVMAGGIIPPLLNLVAGGIVPPLLQTSAGRAFGDAFLTAV